MNNKFKTVFAKKVKTPLTIAISTGMSIAALTSCADAVPAEPSYAIVGEEVPGNGSGNVPAGDVNEERNLDTDPMAGYAGLDTDPMAGYNPADNNIEQSGEGWTLSGNILTIDGVDIDVSLLIETFEGTPEPEDPIGQFANRITGINTRNIEERPDDALLEVRITNASDRPAFAMFEIRWRQGSSISDQIVFR